MPKTIKTIKFTRNMKCDTCKHFGLDHHYRGKNVVDGKCLAPQCKCKQFTSANLPKEYLLDPPIKTRPTSVIKPKKEVPLRERKLRTTPFSIGAKKSLSKPPTEQKETTTTTPVKPSFKIKTTKTKLPN